MASTVPLSKILPHGLAVESLHQVGHDVVAHVGRSLRAPRLTSRDTRGMHARCYTKLSP